MKTFEHGGNIYNAAGQAEDWLDFSANINPLGLSKTVKAAITSGIDGLIHYPDPKAQSLKNAIATRYNVPFENIITLNGAAEGFYLFFNTFRPRRVMIPVPSFSEYERAAKAAGCDIKYFNTHAEENFKININALIEALEGIECVILGSPNNPTGGLLTCDEIERLLDKVEFVIVDESFVDFLGNDYSVRQLIKAHSNLIVMQSLTKFFAIPGLRLGFALATEIIINHLELGKDVWNVNYLAQRAGVAALDDEDYINETRRWLVNEKEYFIKRLRSIEGVRIFEATVNFVLIEFETLDTALKVIDYLKIQHILVRSCANFRGLDGRYIRMAIRSRQENCRVLDILSQMAIKSSDAH